MDIEILAEMTALMTANPARGVERQLAGAGAILAVEDREILRTTYHLLWRLHCSARLLTEKPLDPAALGEGGRAFLLRETGEATEAALSARLASAVALAAGVIARQFGAG
jgi:glutamate-ammonia-ligase adenylyltransferase